MRGLDSLYIPGQTGSFPTPEVDFDAGTGLLVLSGESHPEDPAAFYAPLLAWLDAFARVAARGAALEVRLTFFSASTHAHLLALMARLGALAARGQAVRAVWQVDPDDEDMVETAAEFAAASGLQIDVAFAEPRPIARAV